MFLLLLNCYTWPCLGPWVVLSLTDKPIQSTKKVLVRGLVNFVPADTYLFCLNLPAAFSQPRTKTFFWALHLRLCTKGAKRKFIRRSGYANHDEWQRGLIGRILRHTPASYTQRVGEISSPRYPLKMTNKVFNHCLWTIEVRYILDKFVAFAPRSILRGISNFRLRREKWCA